MSRGENEELLTPSPAPIDAAEADAMSPCSITESPAYDSGSFNLSAPPELRAMWADPPSDDVPVRGPTYMDDQVKVPAGPSVATLLHFDLWTTSTPEKRHHAARFDTQRGPNSVIRTCAARHPDALVFVLNIMLPDSNNVSLVSYWLVPKYMDDTQQDPFYTLLRRFCDPVDGDSADFRDRRFKMIPSFTQAPWIINSLVQSRPALTGQKLTQTYYRQDNYIEVDMDISSSTIAHYIGSLCQSWATYIEVDVFVTVQGEEEHELPEKILGGVRLTYVDLSLAQPVDDEDVVEEDDNTTEE